MYPDRTQLWFTEELQDHLAAGFCGSADVSVFTECRSPWWEEPNQTNGSRCICLSIQGYITTTQRLWLPAGGQQP